MLSNDKNAFVIPRPSKYGPRLLLPLLALLLPSMMQAEPAEMATQDQMAGVLSRLFQQSELSTSPETVLGPARQVPELSKCVRLFKRVPEVSGISVVDQKQRQSKTKILATDNPEFWESSYHYVGGGFGGFLYKLRQGLQQKDYRTLAAMMHPRLKASESQMIRALGHLPLGDTFRVSYHDVWAVYSHDYSSNDVPCPEQNVVLSPLYGYPLQFFLWLSLTGQEEMARVLAIVVPVKGELYLGLLRAQMWTYQGKAPGEWVDEANSEVAKGDDISAYVKYRIAEKHLHGGSYFRFNLEDNIKLQLEMNDAPARWFAELQRVVSVDSSVKTVKATAIMSGGGVAIFFRFSLPKEWSVVATQDHCKKTITHLKQFSWFHNLSGIRCGYYLPHETNFNRDGPLGSIFMLSDSVKNQSK
ncbi:MAG: hypothetical protein OXC40_04485 [Proteobacteria bacterium]|nr:hypothetical protein [Pseudomonadota bacterium]